MPRLPVAAAGYVDLGISVASSMSLELRVQPSIPSAALGPDSQRSGMLGTASSTSYQIYEEGGNFEFREAFKGKLGFTTILL